MNILGISKKISVAMPTNKRWDKRFYAIILPYGISREGDVPGTRLVFYQGSPRLPVALIGAKDTLNSP